MDDQRPATDPDDRQLARRVERDGDEAAFLALYERHTPRLYQFLYRLVGGAEHRADDLAQETWLRAVRSLGSFRWEASFGTWLTAIALNCHRSEVRGDGRERPLEEHRQMVPTRSEEPGRRVDLERAIARLPDGYRTVLLLHDVEGYRHREIAEMLDVTTGTSKSQLYHARRRMRAWLRPETEMGEAREP